MMKRLRLFLLVLVSSTFFFSAAKSVSAQSQSFPEAVEKFEESQLDTEKVSVDFTTNRVMENIGVAAWRWGVGCTGEGVCPQQWGNSSAMGAVGTMIAGTYQRPASTAVAINDLLREANLVQPAYAQGLGFSSLEPILNLWRTFRNIAYVFFVFLFLIIGFGIIFRQNLGGQTAVTIQQALPRIIVALLAVSFSYAIAGLLIDLMWLSMYFLVTMFQTSGLQINNTRIDYSIINGNVFDLFGAILSRDFAGQAGDVVGRTVENMIRPDSAGAGIGNAVSTVLGMAAGGISKILAALIILFAILFALFRTLFALIRVYIEIILQIIFAPIILMMGAINGNAFGNWLKGLIANLAVFPVLLVFFLIAFLLIGSSDSSLGNDLDAGGFVPPFIPGRGTAGTVGLIAGIGAVMLIPEVVAIMGKFKPASIFDEFSTKAVNNIMTGNQLAAPVAFGGAGGVYGAIRGGASAYNQAGFSPRAILRGMWYGNDVNGVRYGGAKPVAGTGYRAGRRVARVIDRFKSNEGFDPNIVTSQLDEITERLNKGGGSGASGGHGGSGSGGSGGSSGGPPPAP